MPDNGKAPGGEPGDNPTNATTPTADIYSTPTEHQPDGGSGEVPDFFKLLEEAGLTSRKEHPMIRRLRERGHLPDAPHLRPRPMHRPRMGSSDAERERVWRYIEGIARSLAATPEGQRNTRMWGGLKDAYRLAMGANIALDHVTDLIYQAAVTNGLVADDGEASVMASIRSARNAAEHEGPDYLEDRPMVAGTRAAHTIDANDEAAQDAQAGGTPSRFAPLLLNRTALRELPDPEPLIDDVLDQGTVALLYGKWGTGKSFIALDWAASVATGRAWQGRRTEQRRVLYVAAEGAFGLKARVEAWEQAWRTHIADDALAILPQSVNLTNAADVRDLADLIEHDGYGLVIFDTLARCMVGADENSAQDCGEVVDAMTRLRERTPNGRGVVLGVHHTGKDGKTFRGSSVFEAGADTVYSVNADGGTIILDREKRKDGPPLDRHELRLDPVVTAGSCVLASAAGATHGAGHTDSASRLLAIFRQHFASTGATRAELRSVATEAGMRSSGTFSRALNDLLTHRDLVNVGTEKRPFYRLGSEVTD